MPSFKSLCKIDFLLEYLCHFYWLDTGMGIGIKMLLNLKLHNTITQAPIYLTPVYDLKSKQAPTSNRIRSLARNNRDFTVPRVTF